MSVSEPSPLPSGRPCPECGAPLVADLPGGVCAACALRGALALTGTPTEQMSAVVVAEKAGDQVGRYKLLEKIGEGGCGVVYLAEQSEPIRRRVALKVVKLGMDTKQVIARFEAERQALALMDHPHIAKVLDAGATETGRPYFVMELVRGIKITDYCDQNQLSTKERLDLFMQVCQAVQHAHQKGIIHRDLKPSNILVTLHDGVPVPKVIDFGIAKATAQQALTDKTLFTAFQQFLGTPAYMSPEQAELSGLDIDTRSDIYSLGVLLYELLTGHLPFDQKVFLLGGFDAMRRLILEKEPTRPSTRLRALAAGDLTVVARQHQTESLKLVHLIRGDLDWIVMKCLEKDRRRRYESATDLARDIARHLRNEPVAAAAPGALYRLGKFVRRHRLGLSVAVIFSACVIAGVVGSVWQGVRATRAEWQAQENLTLARAQQADAELAKKLAEAAEGRALAALQQATAAKAAALLSRDESLQQQAKVEDLIGFMLFDLSEKLRPIGQADLLRDVTLKISAHYQALTNQNDSEVTLARRYAVSRNLGYALAVQGDIISAERHYRVSLEIAEKLSARETSQTAWLAEISVCHERLGEIKLAQGNLAGALDEFRNSLTISEKLAGAGPSNPVWQERLLIGHLKLADGLRAQGDQSGALMNYQAALKLAQTAVAADPNNTDCRNNLALGYRKTVSFLLREGAGSAALLAGSNSLWLARELADKNPGKNEWQSALAESLDCMGDVWLAEKKTDEALVQYRQALEIRRQLANAFPANAQWQQDLLRSHFKVVDVLANEGKRSKVGGTVHDYFALWKGFFNRGLDITQGFFKRDRRGSEAVSDCSNLVVRVEHAVANYPGNQEWRQDLARISSLYGDLLLGQHLPAAALAQYEKAFVIRKQMAEIDPNAVGAQYWLVLTHVNQAAALSRLHRQAEAFQQARQALLLLGDQVSRWPANAVFLEGPQLGGQRIGIRIPLAPDQLSDADQAFAAGNKKAEALAAKEPANFPAQAEWGDCCYAQAVACWFDDNISQAITCSESALKIWLPLTAAAPTNSYYAKRLRQAHVSLAAFLLMHRQFSDAIHTADQGLETNPDWVELKAIRTLAFFSGGKAAEGWQSLRQNQSHEVGLNLTFSQAVMADLRRLRKMAVTQVDVEKIAQQLASEEFSSGK